MERNWTTGNIFRNVLLFSAPFLLSFFLQTLYGMADLFIIGQYDGVASTTAVSVGSQVMHMLTVMLVGLAMGTTVRVGQAIGANDRARAAHTIGNTLTLFLGLSIVLTGVLLLCIRPIVTIMATPTEAVTGASAYLTVCFIGIPFITAYNIISSIFRGLGDTKSPMIFIAVACAANIVLDYLFIGALHMGPTGAALGTTLSQALSVLLSVCMIRRQKTGIPLTRAHLRPQTAEMAALLKIGVPIALQDGLIQISFITITIIANHRGLNDAAAVGIVEKIMGFMFLMPSTMLSTVSALGAQNIGAGQPKRAVRTMWDAVLIATGFGMVMTVVVQLAAGPIVGLFTDAATADGALVVRLGGQYLRGYIFDCLFGGIQFSFSGYFCACGKSGLSFLHNVLSIFLVRIPGAYWASMHFADTLLPMGLASAAGSLLSVIVCLIAFAALMHQSRQTACKSAGNRV